MEYQIFGDLLPAVSIRLNARESIYTQSDGMAWMTDGISMETNMRGGVMKSLGRMFTGESLFMATYTAQRDGEEITFSSCTPGEIRPLFLDGSMDYICQKSSFLCAQPSISLSVETMRGVSSGLFGGEGFFIQRIHGQGMAWLELDGSIREVDLLPGQRIKVSTGHVAFFESNVNYQVEMIRGFKNILFGGEGLFLTTLEGPGKVWLQTMPISGFASRIAQFMPNKG